MPPKVHGALSLDASRTAIPARPGLGYSKYDLRSGLPELSEQPEQGVLEPFYKIIQPGQRPQEITAVPVHSNVNVSGGRPLVQALRARETVEPIPPGDARDYGTKGGTGTRTVYYKYSQLAPKVPKVPGTEEHTMFEDSESMVMHLTAALLSKCGQALLETLKTRGPGSPLTVGLFSRSAVHAVKQHIATINQTPKPEPQTLIRTADVSGAPRTPSSPNPITGTFSHSTKPIDHIVVVLGVSGTGDVNVVTCYPSPVPTMATIKTSNAPDLDIEEHTVGNHVTKPAQPGTEIKLTW
jgi:hypothetical protein